MEIKQGRIRISFYSDMALEQRIMDMMALSGFSFDRGGTISGPGSGKYHL